MTPAELVAHARAMVSRPAPGTVGAWPRAAALLARQALEAAIDQLWARRAPELAQLSARAQLTCLPLYLRDDELAGEVAFTWAVLSDACHAHAYELGPTAEELEARFSVLDRLVERLVTAAARRV